VLASGMGMPSLAIYATELARVYGVRRIVRVGAMGSLQSETVRLGDVVIASSAHTDVIGPAEGMSAGDRESTFDASVGLALAALRA